MRRAVGLAALLGTWCMLAPAAQSAPPDQAKAPVGIPVFPAAGPIVVTTAIARAKPTDTARRVTVLHEFRSDYRAQYVLAIAGRIDQHGVLWVKLRLQLRPNGRFGWIRASAAQLTTTHDELIVHRGQRKIDMVQDGSVVAQAPVAVGSPGRETPLGDYYVTARFVPDDPFLGVFAVETSAYSKMTEWPGGGLVGIHGTSAPQLLGQAVSHGCVRVSNATAALLRRYAPLGTPITIVAN
jgi:lipoprotein-anchoring transpeptidase ErfK/SrfK